jgi:hypothetical protein
MKVHRFIEGAVAATIATAAVLSVGATAASANTVPLSGSASVEVPPSPAGEMGFTLTINGEEHDFSNVDNSLGGRLTLTWAASQEEPRATIRDCANGADGREILIEEATPAATIWATWVSPMSNEVFGPVEIPSRSGFAAGSVCEGADPAEEDPQEEPVEEPEEEPEPEPQDEKEKKDKPEKPKDKTKLPG